MGAVDCKPMACKPADCKPCCISDPADAELREAIKDKTPVLGAAFDVHDEHHGATSEISAQDASGSPSRLISLKPPTGAPKPGGNMRIFEIHLEKSTDQKFGVDVEVHQPKLRIRLVGPGIVEDWNKQNPSFQVLAGNFITKVNGHEGDAMKLIDIILSGSSLAMTIEADVPLDHSQEGSASMRDSSPATSTTESPSRNTGSTAASSPSRNGCADGGKAGGPVSSQAASVSAQTEQKRAASPPSSERKGEAPANPDQILKFHSAMRWRKSWEEIQNVLNGVPLATAVRWQDPRNGNTALHIASQNGHLDVVKMLVASGALVNTQNSKGQTPLHYSVAYDFHLVCQFLISNGADIQIKNNDGQKAIQGFRKTRSDSDLSK